MRVGETVEAVVDAERRAHTMRNHTGTHLLHRALRNVVGDTARQAGSLVTPDYLRFDYPFDRALTDDEKRAIEDEVRGVVRDDRPVTIAFMSMAEAIEQGADAFFDEKYGETVRTIRVEDYSFELCGGTHCRATGQIGGFVITGERSIGSGMRRIEALTGAAADRLARERAEALERVAGAVGAQTVDAIEDRIAALQEELRETKRRLKAGGRTGLPQPTELAARAEEVAPGVRLVAAAVPYESMDDLKAAAKAIRHALPSGVIALFLDDDAPQVFVTVSDDLVERGIGAGDLVKAAAGPLGAKGGGRPEMAQGMGTRREGLAEAQAALREAVRAAHRVGGLMAFWRRIWQRDEAESLAVCTALDIGTEFAKALVFEIDDSGLGTVRGVGRKRQGLSHMQSGTVADIAAVVDNCAVALQEAEEMAGFRPEPGRHRHRRRARQGLHDDPQPGAQEARPADHRERAPEAHRLGPARGAARGRAGDHLGDRAAPRRRPARPRGGDRRGHRRLRPHQPGRVPGPPRQDRDLQRVRARSSTSGRCRASPRSSTWSCSRSWPSRTRSPASSAPSRSARPARCSSTSAAARPTSRSCARAASRGRACSRSAAGRSRSRSPTGWTCRSRGPRRSRSTTPAGCRSSRATRSRRSSATTCGSGRRASSS